MQEIDDSTADLIITTGSTAPGGNNLLRNVLRDLAAHWLIDGITLTPGAQVLLARLSPAKWDPDETYALNKWERPYAQMAVG